MGTRVTLETIAAASDTSVATVSLALRQKPGVSRATRDKILRVADELGYESVPRASAESGTRTAAVILRSSALDPERTYPLLNQFYSVVLSGVQHAANQHHINLVLGQLPVTDDFRTAEMPAAQIFESAPDGILMVGHPPSDALTAFQDAAQRGGFPLVVIDAPESATGYDTVSTCNRHGTAFATRHLIEHGHRDIVFANLPDRSDPNFDERFDGYTEAMRGAGLNPREIKVANNGTCLFDTFDFTAVVARNDHSAISVVRHADVNGLTIPDDLSIVGFDNAEYARVVRPGLTTMAIDQLAMGRLGVELLNQRQNLPAAPSMHVTLEARLIERGSVATPRNRTEGEGIIDN